MARSAQGIPRVYLTARHATLGEHGAHADVYNELLKQAAKADALRDINKVLLEVLDDVDICVRAGDMERLQFVAFVWSQAQDRIVSGVQDWKEQRIPPHVLGGGKPIHERRREMLADQEAGADG